MWKLERSFPIIQRIAAFSLFFFVLLPGVEAKPEGVLREAIHWNISANELDPGTGYLGVAQHLPLYLFHDSLIKIMPEGLYTPSLAESWTISPDARIFEFRLRNVNSPAAIGPRVKGNPYRIQPTIWFTAPFEDIEIER